MIRVSRIPTSLRPDAAARAAALVVGALLLGACSEGGGAGAGGEGPGRERGRGGSEAVAVIAHEVTLQRERLEIEAVGTSRARTSAVIYPETGGEVEQVLFATGDFVQAGDALLQMESQREALAVELAEVEVENARVVLERYRRIETSGAVPVNEVDAAQAAMDAARIALRQARIALAERTVRAPFSGYVGLTDVDPGARITATTQITQLDDREVLYVDFEAPEEVFGRIATGDGIRVASFAEAGRERDARIIGLDSRIEPASRTVTVRAEVDNRTDQLRPGMSFRVFLSLTGAEYPAIPEAALLWGSDGPYLWRLEDDRVTRGNVEIVARQSGYVLVRGEVEAGARVVMEGIHKVREGSVVTVLDTIGLGEEPRTRVADGRATL